MRYWLAILLLAVGLPCMGASRVISLAPSLSEIVVELGPPTCWSGASMLASHFPNWPLCPLSAAMAN